MRISELRRKILTSEERGERTKLLVVRVPSSWHRLLTRNAVNVSDLLLTPVADRVRQMEQSVEAIPVYVQEVCNQIAINRERSRPSSARDTGTRPEGSG